MAALGLGRLAAACSCMDSIGVCERPPVPGDGDRANFLAIPPEVSPPAAQRKEPALLRIHLDVKENFMGADSPAIEVYTSSQSSACGFSFSEGDSYLVEAARSPGDTRWHVSLCSRTNLADHATE